MNKPVLVTGGAGFIGSHLIDYLLEKGFQVIGIDNFSQGNPHNLKSARKNSRFSLLERDITSPGFIEQISEYNLSMIFHLAFPVGVETVMQTQATIFENHYKSSLELFNWAAEKHIPLFFASSSEVYGNPVTVQVLQESDALLPENFDLNSPRFVYGKVKRELELHGLTIFEKQETPFIAGRYFNVFGSRQAQNQGMVIPNFLNDINQENPISIYGDGSQVRSFCPVDFAVKVSTELLSKNRTEQFTVNIGLPESITIQNLAEWMIQTAESSSKIDFISLENKPGRSEAIHTRIPDISCLLNKLPEIGLPDFKQELRNMIRTQKDLLHTHE
ncbi:NAD-dependent epimerase/dehydratase family protein [bacterium]|nr:MAG: NAD-dependent epimerase/dehydratase family protein [bacterium]